MDTNDILDSLVCASEKYYNKSLDKEVLEDILSISHIKFYKKGEIISAIGEKNNYVGFILSGLARSYYIDNNGNDITKNFHCQYYLIMDECFIGYDETICVYEALSNCTILFIENALLKNIVMNNNSIKELYILILENALRYKIYRENIFLTSNATQRYIQFRKDFPELIGKVNQSYISTYLGIAPESLSRIKKTLRDNV